jgi:hypothetical protein
MNFYNIKNILSQINNLNINSNIYNKNIYLHTRNIHIDNLYGQNFVNSNSYNDAIKYLKNYKVYTIKINNLIINLYIFYHNNYNVQKLVSNIYKYLQFFYKTFYKYVKNYTHNVNIFIYTLNYKNKYNKPILGVDDINSAYTTIKPINKKKIVIYKTHKLTKVLIHELIHIFDIDENIFPSNIYNYIDKYIKTHIKSNYEILTFEGITEFFAIYLNTIFKYKNYSLKHIELKLNEQINIYTKYMNIILRNQNIDNIKDLFNGKVEFKQQTNVFSYYILATLLFKNYKNLFTSNNVYIFQ